MTVPVEEARLPMELAQFVLLLLYHFKKCNSSYHFSRVAPKSPGIITFPYWKIERASAGFNKLSCRGSQVQKISKEIKDKFNSAHVIFLMMLIT